MSKKHNNTRTLCELCNDDGKTDNLCRPCKAMIDKRRKEREEVPVEISWVTDEIEFTGCQADGDPIDDLTGLEEAAWEMKKLCEETEIKEKKSPTKIQSAYINDIKGIDSIEMGVTFPGIVKSPYTTPEGLRGGVSPQPYESGGGGGDYLHETNMYGKLKLDPDNNLYTEQLSGPIPVDELHNKRQVGKAFVGPALLMELFGYMLQIGKEKGYKDGSWEQYIHDGHDVMPSIKRHMVGSEMGVDDGWYTEKRPDGTPCPTKAHHDYALFWNAAIRALQRYYKERKL